MNELFLLVLANELHLIDSEHVKAVNPILNDDHGRSFIVYKGVYFYLIIQSVMY